MEVRLEVAGSIVAKGKAAYDADEVAREAGDSLMIKIGEAVKTLATRGPRVSYRKSPDEVTTT